jgi:hypothetical protein
MSQFNQQFITLIIDRYGLELDDYQLDQTVATWLQKYGSAWVVKAMIESVYRGRYKIKSVDSILRGWQQAGKPSYKFTPEFEREILQDLPKIVDLPETPAPPILLQSDHLLVSAIQSLGLSSEQLNPEESAPFLHHHRLIPTAQEQTTQEQPILERDKLSDLSIPEPPSIPTTTAEDDPMDRQEAKTNQLIPPSAKFQLFRTLRAIVEPNSPDAADFSNLDDYPLSPNNRRSQLTHLRFSLENVNGE